MRIATSQIYSLGSDAITQAQSTLFTTQQKISSGQRMLSPSDDPVGSAQVIVTAQAQARVGRFSANITTAIDDLSLEESILGDVTSTITSIRTLAVNGGAGSLSDLDRASLANDLEGQLADLIGLANSRGADGSYLFSGFQVATQPFAKVGSSYTYSGDQGQRTLAVADGRDIAVSDSGEVLFNAVTTGNGVFTASAAAGNTGSGTIDGGSVVNSAALTGNTYELRFAVGLAGTSYSVVNVSAIPEVVEANGVPYTSGSAITVHGMQVDISGAPANGDEFTLAPSGRQSVFETVQDLIATLRIPSSSAGGRTAIANGIGTALQNLDHAQEAVLTIRTELGARLRELDSLSTSNDARSLGYETTLSRLQDLDYSVALSDFARQQLALEAAQKSFLQVSGLSLFSLM